MTRPISAMSPWSLARLRAKQHTARMAYLQRQQVLEMTEQRAFERMMARKGWQWSDVMTCWVPR